MSFPEQATYAPHFLDMPEKNLNINVSVLVIQINQKRLKLRE